MPFGKYKDFKDCVAQNKGKENPEAFCAWMEHEETGQWPVLKSEPEGVYLAGPIVHKNEALRIITGPVLVPGEKDSDGEVVSTEKVEEVALKYMEFYGMIDIQHTFNQVAKPVESWLTRKQESFTLPDGRVMVVPKGTWMMSAKVRDDKVWQGILDKKLTGFSIAGIRKAEIERVIKSENPNDEFTVAVKRRTLLRDLGKDWVAIAVSIVDTPAVYKSKMGWIAIKSEDEESPNLLSRLWKQLNADVKISNKQTEDAMDDKEKKELEGVITAAVKAGVAEANKEKIETEVKAKTDAEPTKTEDKTKSETKTETDAPDSKFGGEIQTQKMKLLKLYETEDSDEKTQKLSDLRAQIKMLEKMERDSQPKDNDKEIKALKASMSELEEKLKGSVSTKSRGIDDEPDVSKKSEDKDEYPRDATGCRI